MTAYYKILKKQMESHSDPLQAKKMAAYMKNHFLFYGIPSPKRKALYKDFLKEEKTKKIVDWELLDQCFEDKHREFQYFACDYLVALAFYIPFEELDRIKAYIQKGNWWDTTDALDQVIGKIGLRDTRIKQAMILWSRSDEPWIKRAAIDHQLLYKEKTDTQLLETILLNGLGSNEFFINKAIGWALRQYSKTNPRWVESFIKQHHVALSSLTIKEASRYLTKKKTCEQ
ncbi:DNA alkylation repair protein [Faecalicoccus pleomorphus]|uniref:DNA alkylation repair protein n=1 Tax=Faecalicoccus pleomorphus TaxID=1323 RepID=UPI001D72B1AD|nr:DNA alkylation repair protein [Faecalicoccus pleomorphus]MBM6764792.1 DNA alkylation repair protein [Faecalicoccus pleomorphus]